MLIKHFGQLQDSGRTADVATFAAGMLLPLAFSPFEIYPLAIFVPAFLFWLWRSGTPGRAMWRGLLFGFGMFGVGVSWIYVSLHNFGNMSGGLAALVTFLFVVILSLFPALLGYIQARFFRRERALHMIFVLPALWVLFEWCRGWFATGFPWLHLGYSQSDTWLAGYAPLLGVYGVSLVVTVLAGLLVILAQSPRRAWLWLGSAAVLYVLGNILCKVEWAEPDAAPLPVVLVQANVSLQEKWNPQHRTDILNRYLQLSQAAPVSRLIVWPEAALPAALHQLDPDFLASLRAFGRRHDTDFLIGTIERAGNFRDYYNSAIVIGEVSGIYRKQHLVPLGEYMPFESLLRPLLVGLEIPMSNLSSAPTPQEALRVAGRLVGVSVCYEDAFGEEVIRTLPQASLLVNISEDAWFGDSLAPHQHLQMAQLRALESARPMLRAANTGPSAAIDHHGRVIARSRQFREYLLYADVQPMRGTTPYVRTGNVSVIVLAAILLFVGWRRARR